MKQEGVEVLSWKRKIWGGVKRARNLKFNDLCHHFYRMTGY